MQFCEVGMVGTSFRRAGQEGLAYFTLADADAVRAMHEACGFQQSVYVATCNRVEVYFTGQPEVSVATFRRRFYAHFRQLRAAVAPPFADARGLLAFAGDGAVEHLFVVASSLDSMVVGEAQILGQVKAALRTAQEQGLCQASLAQTFADAFAIAKRVREQTSLGQGKVSMLSLALALIEEHLIAPEAVKKPRLAVVGVGDMAEQCGRWALDYKDVQLLFVNRTAARAAELAQRYGGTHQSLAAFCADPGQIGALVTATSSPQTLFDGDFLRKLGPRTLLIDLAVGRDVDRVAAQQLHLPLWDIDRLQTRASAQAAARKEQVAHGRALVDEALERYHGRLLHRSLGEAVEAWRNWGRQQLDQEWQVLQQSLLAQQPTPMTAQAMGEVQRFAHRLMGAFLHGPTMALKDLGKQHGVDAVQAFVATTRQPPRRLSQGTTDPAGKR